jgi:hypothetical protein
MVATLPGLRPDVLHELQGRLPMLQPNHVPKQRA